MSTYHIPFPKNFLAVNTPLKKSTGTTVESTSPEAFHGFLSNRPANVARHQSVSSVSSDSTVMSAPASPPTKATADSPVLAAKVFTPLAVNTKHTLPLASLADMTPVARSAFLSNRGAGF